MNFHHFTSDQALALFMLALVVIMGGLLPLAILIRGR